jgi:broad specificity phosphatase PhoE
LSLRLHFLRHGQTPHSRDDRYCGSSDPDLTEDGRAMAAAIGEALGREPFAAIYSSPLRRARETAAPLAGAKGMQVRLVPGLREIGYGEWEGLSPDEAAARDHDLHLLWSADPALHAPPGGERAIDVAARALEAVESIRRDFTDGDVLVVSHKSTIRVVVCALLGIDLGRYRQRLACPVGSLSTIAWSAVGPQLLRLADRAHLPARLRELPGT